MEYISCPSLFLRILVSDQVIFQGQPDIAINTNIGRWEIQCPIKCSAISNVTIIIYWESEDRSTHVIWKHEFPSYTSRSKNEYRFALPDRLEGKLMFPKKQIKRNLEGYRSSISGVSITTTDLTFFFDFNRFLDNLDQDESR